MDTTHEAVREALLELEPEQALDEALRAHLDGCDACRAFAEALASVDAELPGLPPFAPDPALLERTLAAIEALPREPVREPVRGTASLFGAILTGLFGGLWALLGLLVEPFRRPSRKTWAIAVPALAAVALVFVGGVGTLGLTTGAEDDLSEETASVQIPEPPADRESLSILPDGTATVTRGPTGDRWQNAEGEIAGGDIGGQQGDLAQGILDQPAQRGFDQGLFWGRGEVNTPVPAGEPAAVDVDGRFATALDEQRSGERNEIANGFEDREATRLQLRALGYVGDDDREVDLPPSNARGRRLELRADLARDGTIEGDGTIDRGRVDGLTFREPRGYWANTYLPGDPAARALRQRLADDPEGLRLAELAMPAEPSFDAPRSGALALSVEADRAAVEGPTRVVLSVGLRGAAQRAGRRPTLRTQVLLDLRRPLDAEAQGRVRALLDALGRRHTGDDELGVIVAGPDGGARIALGPMRFGELTVALRRAFGPAPADASPLAIRDALASSVESLGQLAEDAPLGSAMVLVVTPGLTDAEARELESVAHLGALAGVGTTVVGLGADTALEPMERVALAGHGRRHRLERAGDADDLARDEITAVSRVVARAVRLRIRLAEGVQLVDVLGSYPLSEVETHRVRAAEQAVDRALAARLGIASDRGADEDGIQIVVPAFYADDAHRVLLDLVVSGPGPVADVQARYKDLVRLGNATLTDRLVLGRGAATRGPAQRAVHGAALGHEVAVALRQAAARLDGNDPDGARAILDAARAHVEAQARAIPELASEPALGRDLSLFRRYTAALPTRPAESLAGSLRYAAHRRLLGDPLGIDGAP